MDIINVCESLKDNKLHIKLLPYGFSDMNTIFITEICFDVLLLFLI